MARDDSEQDRDQAEGEAGLSRRQILAAGLTAAGAGLTTTAEASSIASPNGMVGVAGKGATAVEFRARFAQTGNVGQDFVGYGYLTAAAGAGDDLLFVPGASHSDATALFTAYAVGHLVRRTVDQAVHELDIEGTLTVYQRPGPGASFADPDSFRQGTPVAVFDIALQDIVTVFAPGRGLPTLNGDMAQTASAAVAGASRFGRVGAEARLFATGLGTLVDPVTLNSVLEMAGHWTTK
ncbi:MAG: hypothetical protein AB7O28_23965 [Vicinamibacterales bacterium]